MTNLQIEQEIDNTEYTDMMLHIIAYSILIVVTFIASFSFLKQLFTQKHASSYWYKQKTLSSFLSIGSAVVALLLLINTVIHWNNMKKIQKKQKDNQPYRDPNAKLKFVVL